MRNGEDWTEQTEEQAERAIGYAFRDKRLLKQSFTHKTYANAKGGEHNERLEFLGDAVLQLYVTEELYLHTRSDEGKLTDLRKNYVSEEALNAAAERAGIMKFLRLSGKQENVGKKTPSNLFEAVTAAIYLDGGREHSNAFLSRFLTKVEVEGNAINDLQEYVQKLTKSLPQYDCEEKEGKFHCTASAMGERARGSGKSKQEAKMQAAKALTEILKKRTED